MVMNDWMIGYHDFGNPHDLSNPAAQRVKIQGPADGFWPSNL